MTSTAPPTASPPRRWGPEGVPAAGLGLVLLALVFWVGGGADLSAVTWAEIALVLAGSGLAGAALLTGPRRRPGTLSLVLFGGVGVLTALSIAWSAAPDQSWLAAAQTAAYLAVFAGALAAAWLWPSRWSVVLWAIAGAAVAAAGWAVLVKALTVNVDGQPALGRLLAPFGYWNATGLMSALGLPPLLWIAGRREPGRAAVRGLAAAGMTLLICVVLLSYSRSALAAAVLGVSVPLVLSCVRLRMAAMLAPAAAGAGAVCAWALGDGALTADRMAAPARHAAGHTLGWAILAALLLTGLAGWLIARRFEGARLMERTRRRIGIVLVALVALVPVGAVVAAAASSRGLSGEVSHVWDTLTSTRATIGDRPGRLTAISNSRPRYWRQGIVVGEHHLLAGTGAGSFGVARLAYPTAALTPNGTQHAHSYALETFADLGLIGVALNLALLLAWGGACARTLAPGARAASSEPSWERDGLVALLGVVVAFGVSSAVDWTWFYPALAVPALIAAAWLAGRGRPSDVGHGTGTEDQDAAGAASKAAIITHSWRPRGILAATLLAALALAASWGIWQPLRSADAAAAGISAMASGEAGAAIADARAAHRYDPFSLQPLQELAAIYTALREPRLSRAQLLEAVREQPDNPVPWGWLGGAALASHQPRLALRALRRAHALDVIDPQIAQNLLTAELDLRRPS